ncbi:MAG: OmpA family protein, partial [Flavitalea sp.]
ALMYSGKGRKYFQRNDSTASILTDTISSASNMGINYIEMPLNITYKIPMGSKAQFLLSAGPYVGFFYSGTQKSETRIYSSNDFKSEEVNLETGNGQGKVKTFDAGFNVRAGFELGNVLITGFMTQGLTSFYTAAYDGTFKHHVKGLSLGFWLNKPTPPATPKKVVLPVKEVAVAPKIIPDTDGDGLNDEVDACPNQPGSVEFNGCPIPDSDGDGLNDKEDKCPSDPGPKENGGCPVPVVKADTIQKEVVQKPNFVTRYILFKAGNDKLTDTSSAPLDEVFKVLMSHPGLKLNIEGYTDASGITAHNQALSEKRAAAVKRYLTGKGIDKNRIISKGLGSTKPLDTNKTAEGRANNRRVELKLIQ